MIDIKEIRAGNLLISRKYWSYCIAFKIDCSDRTTFENFITYLYKNKLDEDRDKEFNPVKITEDLLIKLGFGKEVDDIINREYYRLRLNGFCIDINRYSNTLGRDYSVHIDNLCCDSVLHGDIQYLHQLQNYIYDSTKQELNIEKLL